MISSCREENHPHQGEERARAGRRNVVAFPCAGIENTKGPYPGSQKDFSTVFLGGSRCLRKGQFVKLTYCGCLLSCLSLHTHKNLAFD